MVLFANPAFAQSVTVIKSRKFEAFDQVIKSFVDANTSISADQVIEYNLEGKKENWKKIREKISPTDSRFILAMGPLPAQMAKESLSNIPIIFCMVSNPHRYGLSGENLVGISMDVPGETQFTQYKSVMPNLKTLGVIYDPQKSEALVSEANLAAQKLGLELIMTPVSSHKKVPKALRDMLGKIDALWMVPDDTVLTTASFRFFLVTSFEKKLPFLAISDIFVKVGALATIAPAPTELGHQISQLANQLQSGELDLTQVDILAPKQTNLVINVKTAKKIGLDLSPEILESASKLYNNLSQ